ncbi:MAG: rRNA maturation RNase YbeY [Phycisphaerales bacterium]|nr:rRNA maturation RNase YbeY [Phycisphaerales bacterium]
MKSISVKLTLINQTRQRIAHRWLLEKLRRLLELLKIARGQWAITVVDDKVMRALHKRTMNDPAATDVITFDMRDAHPLKNHIDLDTILCRDVAAENAKEYGHSVHEELLLYAVHSLLHVRGYDDRTAAESLRMHRREDALLIRLGVGAIYKGKKPL